MPVQPGHLNAQDLSEMSAPTSRTPNLKLVTWNIDAFGDWPESRVEGILCTLRQMLADEGGPDIIFLQEVSRKALAHLLQSPWVRKRYISSEADNTNWANVPFATMTLLCRSRFGPPSASQTLESTTGASPGLSFSLGPVWRVHYPSRYRRDALCCDIFWNRTTRLRLVNVHLDSLAIRPSQRPRQVAIAASLLRAAGVGGGVIAGDWNPVLEEDAVLVRENGLVDAWECLHPGEDGFTWGLDGKGEPFPPGRLDKVAVLGLKLVDIRVVHPEMVAAPTDLGGERVADNGGKEGVPWSDHSGLVFSFTVEGGIV